MLSVVASAAFWPLLLLPGRVGYSTATDVEEGVRVSYVLTVYNKSRYLPFVIEGLRRQEGDFDREFIFVDDGSTDDSVELIERLTAGLPGVTIHRQANQGPSVATNIGFSRATGDYIKPVDADDVFFPGRHGFCSMHWRKRDAKSAMRISTARASTTAEQPTPLRRCTISSELRVGLSPIRTFSGTSWSDA